MDTATQNTAAPAPAASNDNVLSALPTDLSFSAPVDDLSLVAQVRFYVIIKAMVEAAQARLDKLKESIVAVVTVKGEPVGEKGTVALMVAESKVTVQGPTMGLPTLDALKTLLASKGLSVEDGTDVVPTRKVSRNKLDSLVELGKLTQAEVDGICESHTALRIYPSKALKLACSAFRKLAGKSDD